MYKVVGFRDTTSILQPIRKISKRLTSVYHLKLKITSLNSDLRERKLYLLSNPMRSCTFFSPVTEMGTPSTWWKYVLQIIIYVWKCSSYLKIKDEIIYLAPQFTFKELNLESHTLISLTASTSINNLQPSLFFSFR